MRGRVYIVLERAQWGTHGESMWWCGKVRRPTQCTHREHVVSNLAASYLVQMEKRVSSCPAANQSTVTMGKQMKQIIVPLTMCTHPRTRAPHCKVSCSAIRSGGGCKGD